MPGDFLRFHRFLSKSAPPRCHDPKPIPWLGQNFVFSPQIELSAILVGENVFAPLARHTAFQSVRRINPAFGEDGHVQRLQKFHLADQSVAAAVQICPAGTLTNGEFAQQQWVAAFQDFRIGDAGIGHVAVHAVVERQVLF